MLLWFEKLQKNEMKKAASHYPSCNIFKGICCFLEQETLPSLLSTGWYQEQIRA